MLRHRLRDTDNNVVLLSYDIILIHNIPIILSYNVMLKILSDNKILTIISDNVMLIILSATIMLIILS